MHPLRCLIIHIDIDPAAQRDRQHAQIINTVNVVGVRMGIQNRIDIRDAGSQHLFAKVRARVDHDRCGAVRPDPADEQGAAPAAILRIFRIA